MNLTRHTITVSRAEGLEIVQALMAQHSWLQALAVLQSKNRKVLADIKRRLRNTDAALKAARIALTIG